MFTGIISAAGTVTIAKQENQGLTITIVIPTAWKLRTGASISINGVCSTVAKTGNAATFQYMPESIQKTNLKKLRKGSLVNLEQSLRASDRLDGHIVLGHVDTAGTIINIVPEGNSHVFSIKINPAETRLVTEKGSITIEGISLTVTKVTKNTFVVKIIPYTWEHTNLNQKKVGDTINIEFDILAKYIAKLIGK